MKKIFRTFSMAALALVGVVMTGCSEDVVDNPQPANNKSVTLTMTVSIDEGAATRALNVDYTNSKAVKTFAVGEQIAVVYQKNGGATAKAVSDPLTALDISGTGTQLNKLATFTVTLNDPKAGGNVQYIYPAAMADDMGFPNLDALATQDGTLASLAANLDYAAANGNMTGTALPNLTLFNQLAILSYTLYDDKGTVGDKTDDVDITSTITGMTISDGTNNYAVTGRDADGHIYVAIRPTTSADIYIAATDGTQY